jgi:hypothetical protein
VNVQGIKELKATIANGGVSELFHGNLKDDPVELAVSGQLASVVPAKPCFANWFLATRLRRVKIAREIAADCVGSDATQQFAIDAIFDKSAHRLSALAATWQRGHHRWMRRRTN